MIFLEAATGLSAYGAIICAIISSLTSIGVLFISIRTKNPLERAFLRNKLELEHNFEQRRKIKDTLSEHKIHIITACENLKLRMWHWANHMDAVWDKNDPFYSAENYFLHSTAYTVLCVYANIQQLQKKLILLDTTIADPEDLEFVKFLQVFSHVFSNTREIDVYKERKITHDDHFSRVYFETFPEILMDDDFIVSYTKFRERVHQPRNSVQRFLDFLQSTTHEVNPNRWERFHLLYLTAVIFLNNFGYSFQKTGDEEIEKIINKPQRPKYLDHYIRLLTKYELSENPEVRRFARIAAQFPAKEPSGETTEAAMAPSLTSISH